MNRQLLNMESGSRMAFGLLVAFRSFCWFPSTHGIIAISLCLGPAWLDLGRAAHVLIPFHTLYTAGLHTIFCQYRSDSSGVLSTLSNDADLHAGHAVWHSTTGGTYKVAACTRPCQTFRCPLPKQTLSMSGS